MLKALLSNESKSQVSRVKVCLAGLSLQEMLHFARGRSPVKMQKALANVRLPGALPGAESLANMPIANEHVRALAPGKFAPGKDPGTTPGKMRLIEHRLFRLIMAKAVLCRPCLRHVSPFQKHVMRFARG
jgi:hypothetical protein